MSSHEIDLTDTRFGIPEGVDISGVKVRVEGMLQEEQPQQDCEQVWGHGPGEEDLDGQGARVGDVAREEDKDGLHDHPGTLTQQVVLVLGEPLLLGGQGQGLSV